MPGPRDLKFEKAYTSEEKMRNVDEGVFSTKFTSYIGDGTVHDKTHKGQSREDILTLTSRNLLLQMREANANSATEAESMRKAHADLRREMVAALNKIREVSRERDLLKAKLLVEESKRSGEKATEAMAQLDAMLRDKQAASLPTEQADQKTGGVLTGKELQKSEQKKARIRKAKANKEEDIHTLESYKTEISGNINATHGKGILSLFRATKKAFTRMGIEKDIKSKNEQIKQLQDNLRSKASEWNTRRQTEHQGKTFRKFYDDYDKAASSYYMMNRTNGSMMLPKGQQKDIKEYVGEFDLEELDRTLADTNLDMYREADEGSIKIANKNKRNSDKIQDFVKSHEKLTLTSGTDQDGNVIRYKVYKLGGDDSTGYMGYKAKRQFSRDKKKPTALIARKDFNRLRDKKSFQMLKSGLAVDEKDAGGNYINTRENVRIVQAKQNKKNGEILNGIFLNGQFVSTDRDKIKGIEDSKRVDADYVTGVKEFVYSGLFFNSRKRNWELTKQEEEVRGAVLKASIFRQLNSRTIQHMAGYGAAESVNAGKINKSLAEGIRDQITGKEGLFGWEEYKGGKKKEELDKLVKKISARLFSEEHEKDVLDAQKSLDELEVQWKDVLLYGRDEEKKRIPREAKIKLIYDYLRKEHTKRDKNDVPVNDELLDTNTEVGRLLESVQDDHQVLEQVSLLLLSNDNKPEYWNLAKTICTELRLTAFEKKFKNTFDSRFKRAVVKGRAESGQLMRVALIDELLADRSRSTSFVDIVTLKVLNKSLLPTRFKQFREDQEGKRGIKARLAQEALNGTFTNMITAGFSTAVDYLDNTDYLTKGLEKGTDAFDAASELLDDFQTAQLYTGVLQSVTDFGVMAEGGAMAISDAFAKDYGEKWGGRGLIGLTSSLMGNVNGFIEKCIKVHKTRKKEIEIKAKKQPSYDPENDLALLDNKILQVFNAVSGFVAGSGKELANYLSKNPDYKDDKDFYKQLKNTFGLVKNITGLMNSSLTARNSFKAVKRLNSKETELNTLMSKDVNTMTYNEKNMYNILKENSQLQYGLSCAKRKAQNDRVGGVFGCIKNGVKTVLGFFKLFAGEEITKTGPFTIIDGIWETVIDSVKMGTEMVRDKLAVRADIGKMIGDKYKGMNKSMISGVLRREAGIASTDYLLDLGRIFMAMNTDVYMKEAETKTEKKLGADIMKALTNNKNFGSKEDEANDYQSLKKGHFRNLMGVMGVKGNFHGILKHALA